MGILDVKNFSFAYPDSRKTSLEDINFSIEEGEFFVLCGTSGCGKSTLLRNLKTALRPSGRATGSILYKGTPMEELDERIQSAEIGYVLQNPDNQLVTDKVWHELAFGLESLGYDNPTIQLRVSEMASYFDLSTWLYKDVNSLSGGQKQLLNLASVMALHPTVLILDEPTSQLDPITASDFLGTIKKINQELGTTIIITEHRLEDIIPVADQVVVMDEGRLVVRGRPTDVGKELKRQGHPMFKAMPAPMQIHVEVEPESETPLTVRTGRQWLTRLFAGKEDIQSMTVPPIEPKTEEPILEFKDVWFRYEQDMPDVVKGMNLKLYPGEIYCLLGGNGVGKSTSLSLMCKIHHPYRGRILVRGKNIRKMSGNELFHGLLGVLPQNPQSLFVKKTVEEELFEMIGGSDERRRQEYDADMSKAEAVAGFATLVHLENRLRHHPYDLSGGEQQRLALAKILLLKPKLLLMDEPTKGMDRAFKEEFAEIIGKLKAHGVCIFMISHDLEFCAQYADRCGLFFDGRVVHSTTPRDFFTGNNFYTTSSNRMARHIFPNAITVKDVITCCRKNL